MTTRIAVAGAGLVGRRHIQAINLANDVTLAGIVDPAEPAQSLAASLGVPYYHGLADLLTNGDAHGVILATPNQVHVQNAMECINAQVPVLVEKPLAVDLSGARRIVMAGEKSGVPVLTGHHRRHNPLIVRARQAIADGELGAVTAVQATTWFHKPDDYFDVQWRCRAGAGPVYINLIHDIDMLRHLCGDIEQVHAMESRAVRQNEVEDTAVILLKFVSGALGTVSVSDTIPSPWSWELTARENPAYPATDEICYQIGGTKASLALPNLAIWRHLHKSSWWEPISATRLTFGFDDPLLCQVLQFAAVIKGKQLPLVSAREGYENQRVIESVKRSAATGQTITVNEIDQIC